MLLEIFKRSVDVALNDTVYGSHSTGRWLEWMVVVIFPTLVIL